MIEPSHLAPADLMSDFPEGSSERRDVEIAAATAIALRELMQRLGGVRAVARALDSTHTTVSAVALGTRWPSLTFIIRVEDAVQRSAWLPHPQCSVDEFETL